MKKKESLWKRVSDFAASDRTQRHFVTVLGVFVLIVMFMLAIVPMRYKLQVGMVPTVTITATKDVVDEVETEKRRQQAADAVTPTYRLQEGVTEQVMADFESVFAQLRLAQQYAQTLEGYSAQRAFTKDELDYARGILSSLSTLRDYQITSLLRCTTQELDEAYSLLYTALQSTMQSHVTEGQEV